MNLPPLPYPQSPGNDYTVDQMQAYANAAIMQADTDAQDAARYRWLRDNSNNLSWNPSWFNATTISGFSYKGTGYLGFNFQPAIDAAMEQSK